MRGPLTSLKEQLVGGSSPRQNILDFVSQCRERLHRASLLAKEALLSSQETMKVRFDRKAVERQFQPGDQVLVLLPTPGSALTARFSGPYSVISKIANTDYVIRTPERRRKTRLCHINMLKAYHTREAKQDPVERPAEEKLAIAPSLVCVKSEEDDVMLPSDGQQCGRLSNSVFLSSAEHHLSYLCPAHRQDVLNLLEVFPTLFGDVPTRINVVEHDIDVGSATPIKQHAYRCPLDKRETMKKEVAYVVEHGLAQPSCSLWSSPCLLESDGTPRFCTDFRKENSVTVPDSFPLPHMEDSIDLPC